MGNLWCGCNLTGSPNINSQTSCLSPSLLVNATTSSMDLATLNTYEMEYITIIVSLLIYYVLLTLQQNLEQHSYQELGVSEQHSKMTPRFLQLWS